MFVIYYLVQSMPQIRCLISINSNIVTSRSLVKHTNTTATTKLNTKVG